MQRFSAACITIGFCSVISGRVGGNVGHLLSGKTTATTAFPHSSIDQLFRVSESTAKLNR